MKNILDEITHFELIQFFKNQNSFGRKANRSEVENILAANWLVDSVVLGNYSLSKSGWDIFLIFVNSNNPFQIIRKYMTTVESENKAKIIAYYMQKTASKDHRASLEINTNKLNICAQ